MKAISTAAILAALAAAPAAAQGADPLMPSAWSRAPVAVLGARDRAVLAFLDARPGARVADLYAPRLVAPLGREVGPRGQVFAVLDAARVRAFPQELSRLNALAAQAPNGNTEVSTPTLDAPALPAGLDAVVVEPAYAAVRARLDDPGMRGLLLRNLYAALKPGGVAILQAPLAPAAPGEATQRAIDPGVLAEVLGAGFVLDGQQALTLPGAGGDDSALARFRRPQG